MNINTSKLVGRTSLLTIAPQFTSFHFFLYNSYHKWNHVECFALIWFLKISLPGFEPEPLLTTTELFFFQSILLMLKSNQKWLVGWLSAHLVKLVVLWFQADPASHFCQHVPQVFWSDGKSTKKKHLLMIQRHLNPSNFSNKYLTYVMVFSIIELILIWWWSLSWRMKLPELRMWKDKK